MTVVRAVFASSSFFLLSGASVGASGSTFLVVQAPFLSRSTARVVGPETSTTTGHWPSVKILRASLTVAQPHR